MDADVKWTRRCSKKAVMCYSSLLIEQLADIPLRCNQPVFIWQEPVSFDLFRHPHPFLWSLLWQFLLFPYLIVCHWIVLLSDGCWTLPLQKILCGLFRYTYFLKYICWCSPGIIWSICCKEVRDNRTIRLHMERGLSCMLYRLCYIESMSSMIQNLKVGDSWHPVWQNRFKRGIMCSWSSGSN